MQLAFADGSTAAIHYLSNGSKDFPKERIEVFAGGKVFQCDNFRSTKEFGGSRKFGSWRQDKGHACELERFLAALREGGPWPIPAGELLEVSEHSIRLAAGTR